MKKKIDNIILIFLSLLLIASSILSNDISNYYTYIKISIYVLLIIYLCIKMIKKEPVQIIKNKLDICVVILIISSLIPLITNTYISLKNTVIAILQYTYVFSIYILFREFISKNKIRKKIVANILIILTILIIIIGIDDITTKTLTEILKNIGLAGFLNGEDRLISVIGYPNALAVYVASMIFLNINEYLNQEKKGLKSLYKLLTTIFILAIILTYSKAVMILLPIILFAYILSIKEKRREITQNVIISYIISFILVFIFEKLSNQQNYLLLWILTIITLSINYLINLIIEKRERKTSTKKIIIISIITLICFTIYLIIGLNIYDEYNVFTEDIENDYDAKIIDNITGNTQYLLDFDIEAMAPKDIKETYTINIIQRDEKNQEVNEKGFKFGTYKGKKQIEITTEASTKEIKIEFKSEYKYKQKKLLVKELTINNKKVPLKYKYLPTKLVEKIKNININYKTFQERIEMIKNGLEIFIQKPLTGMGGNAWKYKYKEVQNYNYIADIIHSYPVKIMIESGILGITAYIVIVVIITMLMIKAIKNKNIEDISILFALMIIFIHNIIDMDMKVIHIFCYVFGLLGILSNKIETKENKNKQLNLIINAIVILISITSIYFNINKTSYDKYANTLTCIKQGNGLDINSEEYKKANMKIAKSYEEMIKYERYDQIGTYFEILDCYMKSDAENKLEILEKYYKKILEYQNKQKYNIENILIKTRGINNIVKRIEQQDDSIYYKITEKYIDIVIKEYPETKKQIEECLERQHEDSEVYITQLEDIYNDLIEIKESYILGVKVWNDSELKINEEELKNITIDPNQGDILIYHTHTSESYKSDNEYETYDFYKSLNENYNVIKVGKSLTQMLKEKGIDAIHNTKYHNYPIKTDTYLKSRNTVQNILSQNKNITKIIDIHRDSYSDKETTASTIEISGEKAAPMRFVIGINPENNDWMYDLKWAIEMQKLAQEKYPNLFKPILIRQTNYNQDLSKYAILIEIGENCNYIEDVINSTKYLADILSCKIQP